MMLNLLRSDRKTRAAQRVLAVLLLSLSFVDLVVVDLFLPQGCEDGGIIIYAATTLGDVEGQSPKLSQSSDTQHQESSESVLFDEDCFCCCAHIMPSAHFSFPALPFQVEQGISQIDFLPSAPPLETFHPPRIA